MRSDVKKISNKRLTKYQIKNTLAAAFSCLVFAGAATVGVMLILSETLYYEIEDFSLLPLWYKLVMLAGFLAVLAGLVGCLFTKNRLNTTRIEIKLNLCLFAAGFVLMLIFALLPTEARWAAVMIGIGGAVSTVGLFSGIASLIGFMKKPKSHYVSELIYKYYSGSLNDEDIVAWRQNKAYNKFVKWWGMSTKKTLKTTKCFSLHINSCGITTKSATAVSINSGISRKIQNGMWKPCGKGSERCCPKTNFYVLRRR